MGLKGPTIHQKEFTLAKIQNLTHIITSEVNLCLKISNDSLFFNLLIKLFQNGGSILNYESDRKGFIWYSFQSNEKN